MLRLMFSECTPISPQWAKRVLSGVNVQFLKKSRVRVVVRACVCVRECVSISVHVIRSAVSKILR